MQLINRWGARCCWLRSIKHGCVLISPAISVPKEKYDMQEKQRCMILFFSIFEAFLISSTGSLLASESLKIFTAGKSAIIR